jgi:O-antigen/teichoic acid export membrane protein
MGEEGATRGDREGDVAIEPLASDELIRRAASGAAVLGARNALIYVFGIAANLVLARLLVPRDFGLVALGTVVLVLGTYLAEGGFGAALIRRERAPSTVELQALFAFQLLLSTVLALTVTAIAAPFGRDGLVIVAMVASVPIAVVRAPSVLFLERQLKYRVIAKADVVEALAYYLWAITAAALGFGVWGMATAVIARATAGTATVLAIGPLGLMRPRWSWPHVRPLLRFGAMVQTTSLLQIAREQLVNIVVAAVAGIATLGVWNLAWRVLQVPNLLFLIVGRVAFPAVSRLLGAGQDPRPVIERGLAGLAAVTGAVTVALVGFAPALPALVGGKWHDVPAVLLWSGIALIISIPISVACTGYLFAAGEASVVAGATLASAATWLAVAIVLLPTYGAPAVGVGWVATGTVNCAFLWRRTASRTGAAIGRNLVGPTTVSLAAAAGGWLVAQGVGEGLSRGIVGLVVGELIVLPGLMIVSRSALRDARSLVSHALASFGRRRRESAARRVEKEVVAR